MERSNDEAAMSRESERRTIMVFLRDTERGIGNGYKTTGTWRDGVFDAAPWREGGEFDCDCARGPMLYYGREGFPCGTTRFVVERIVVWDTGETVYSETGLE